MPIFAHFDVIVSQGTSCCRPLLLSCVLYMLLLLFLGKFCELPRLSGQCQYFDCALLFSCLFFLSCSFAGVLEDTANYLVSRCMSRSICVRFASTVAYPCHRYSIFYFMFYSFLCLLNYGLSLWSRIYLVPHVVLSSLRLFFLSHHTSILHQPLSLARCVWVAGGIQKMTWVCLLDDYCWLFV